MFCPKCGKENEDDSLFCRYCGTGFRSFLRMQQKNEVPVDAKPEKIPGREKESQRSWLFWIGLAVMILFMAVFFLYAVLGAGFFSTLLSPQRGQQAGYPAVQQTVYQGIQQASSNLIIIGEVIGDATGTNTGENPYVHNLLFTIGLAAGGSPVDMSIASMSFQTRSIFHDGILYGGIGENPSLYQWKIVRIAKGDGDAILERYEEFTISVRIGNSPSNGLKPNEDFTLTINPDPKQGKQGASFPLHKSVPAVLEPETILT